MHAALVLVILVVVAVVQQVSALAVSALQQQQQQQQLSTLKQDLLRSAASSSRTTTNRLVAQLELLAAQGEGTRRPCFPALWEDIRGDWRLVYTNNAAFALPLSSPLISSFTRRGLYRRDVGSTTRFASREAHLVSCASFDAINCLGIARVPGFFSVFLRFLT